MKKTRSRPTWLLLISFVFVAINERTDADETPLRVFLNAVETGEVESVSKLMHPQLASQIDPPILEAWLQAVSFRLGPVVDIVPEYEKSTRRTQEYTATIQFKKGNAKVLLNLADREIVKFEVKSDKLINWFQRPTSLSYYQKRGERFLQELQTQNFASCKKLLHEKTAAQLTTDDLKSYSNKIRDKTGENENVRYRFAKLTVLPNEQIQQIDLFYEIEGDQGAVQAELTVRFQGMKGYIVSFEFYDAIK